VTRKNALSEHLKDQFASRFTRYASRKSWGIHKDNDFLNNKGIVPCFANHSGMRQNTLLWIASAGGLSIATSFSWWMVLIIIVIH
jgi:hypothetical protein